jgi:DNA-binding NtrC family response regulator
MASGLILPHSAGERQWARPATCRLPRESNCLMPKGLKTVLVVDDEPQVLRLVASILNLRTVNLRTAPTPQEALLVCKSEPVDLLISDLRMPGIDGVKLAERLLELQPGAAVLLISGAAKEAPKLARDSRVRFLRKPFFPAGLLKEIRELVPGL